MQEIVHLLRKEWLLESRQKHAIGGIVLYILSTVFVCFLSFKRIGDQETWNALLWIIVLFVSTNAANKSFYFESGDRQLYIYTLASPKAIILSKIIYNSLLIMTLSFIAYAVYAMLLGDLMKNHLIFFLAIALGGSGLSSLLTTNAAIASKTDQNAAMMAILSFPLVMPLLITLIKISKLAASGQGWAACSSLLLILLMLNILITALSYLLFPYLWRE